MLKFCYVSLGFSQMAFIVSNKIFAKPQFFTNLYLHHASDIVYCNTNEEAGSLNTRNSRRVETFTPGR